MFTNSILTKSIQLEPKHLTPHIKETIFEELKLKYEKTCDDIGLIVSIDEITHIDNIINKDSIVITFYITFKAKTIKPEKGMFFSFKPSLILQKGIFGKVHDKINFFIPESNLSENGYIFENDQFISKNKKIDPNIDIHVKIIDFKYDTFKYNCIVHF